MTATLTADGRCPHCGARYRAFRGGMSTAEGNLAHRATVQYDAATVGALDVEDNAHLMHAGHGMVLAGRVKRDAWEAIHANGACLGPVVDDAPDVADFATLAAEDGDDVAAFLACWEAAGIIPPPADDPTFTAF